jgi:uncharacterized membrane protein YkoI
MVLTTSFALPVWAGGITKEQAIEKALTIHPGMVEKAYQETKKGVEVWEVRIKGDDGNTWKTYYRVDNGELFMKKKNDEIVDVETS